MRTKLKMGLARWAAAAVVGAGLLACGWIGGRGTPRPASSVPAAPDLEALDRVALSRFAVIGDFGVDTDAEAQVAALVHSWKPDFVLTTGDNNYPIGTSITLDRNVGKYYASFIGSYHGEYGAGSSTPRFFPTPGNHDWYGPEGLAPYLRYFTLPGNERYYQVRLGQVHLFALDSDRHEPDGNTADSVQGRWLQQQLQASDACLKVVFFHHAPFSSSEHGPTTTMQWPFAAWGANTIMSGHEHVYERFDMDGTPYFTNGLGGAPSYAFNAVQPHSQVRYNADHGAMLVRLVPDGVEYQFRDVGNRLVDRHFQQLACPQTAAQRSSQDGEAPQDGGTSHDSGAPQGAVDAGTP